MVWTTKLINEYLNDKKTFIRDVKLKSLFEDKEFKEPQSPFFDTNNIHKRGNILFQYTDEELRDILMIKKDVKYFSKFIKYDKNNICLKSYQKDILDKMSNNRLNVFHIGRQIGFSLLLTIFIANFSITKSDKIVMFLSNDPDRAFENFINLIKNLPFHMKPGIIDIGKNNRIKFDNGTKVIFSKYNISIGLTINLLVLEDFAFANERDADKIYRSVIPVISALSDSRLIMSSCGSKKEENLFNNIVKKSRDVKSKISLSVYTNPLSYEDVKSWMDYKDYLIEYKCILPDDKDLIRELKLNQLNIEDLI